MGSARINGIVAAVIFTVGGCAHAGTPDMVFGYEGWSKAVRKADLDPSVVQYPFESSPELEAWVRQALARHRTVSETSTLDVIQNAMFDDDFNFTYEDGLTLTAAEAFQRRQGNCMSFTVLFVTMARVAGVEAFLMAVRRPPGIDKEGDLVVLNYHVVAGARGPQKVTIYDFNLTSSEPFMQQFVVDDVMATAMYHNNLAGDAIRHDDFRAAVSHLDITTKLVPEWANGWVNYGVARFRNGDAYGALECYAKALEVQPNHASALTNMAFVYRDLGRYRESETALRAAAASSTNPYTLIAIADAEMIRGDFDDAAAHLRRARWSYRSEPEVWDAMSRLARLRGESKRAEKHAAHADKLRLEAEESEEE